MRLYAQHDNMIGATFYRNLFRETSFLYHAAVCRFAVCSRSIRG